MAEVNVSDAVENPEETASDAQEKVEGVASGLFGEEENESTEETGICEEGGWENKRLDVVIR